MTSLFEELEAYCGSGPYPFHMPGHKRRLSPVPGLPYGWDVTEVPGTDDLHEAEQILKTAMDRTAAFWGAERTWYLINGSTCGLLAGIRALAPAGSRILAARNCHKSVCHAIELGRLEPRWLMPELLESGICGPITGEILKKALEETPDAACVVVTSPTYEGVISPIEDLAELCHARKIPLLVDEAHGAHLGLFPGWPESALHQGADVVVQSVHKTLPSLTQTALLHLGKGSLADPGEIGRQLGIFETSSPSYPLMASIDGCTELLIRQGDDLSARWLQRLRDFDRETANLKHLKILGHSSPVPFAFDPGKLPVSTAGTGLRGPELAKILREQYGLETEMSQGDICLAMTGPGDSEQAMKALAAALREIDQGLEKRDRPAAATLPVPGEQAVNLARAVNLPREEIPIGETLGRIAGEAVWAYPPGIPLILPGERIGEDFLKSAGELTDSGTELHHSRCRTPGRLAVLR